MGFRPKRGVFKGEIDGDQRSTAEAGTTDQRFRCLRNLLFSCTRLPPLRQIAPSRAGTRGRRVNQKEMQIAPEIVYRDVARSDWIESYILERIQRLDKFAQGITRCHVTLTREQASRQKGNRYSVMVEVRVPPQHDLAIKKEKEIREMRTQLPAVIN